MRRARETPWSSLKGIRGALCSRPSTACFTSGLKADRDMYVGKDDERMATGKVTLGTRTARHGPGRRCAGG